MTHLWNDCAVREYIIPLDSSTSEIEFAMIQLSIIFELPRGNLFSINTTKWRRK